MVASPHGQDPGAYERVNVCQGGRVRVEFERGLAPIGVAGDVPSLEQRAGLVPGHPQRHALQESIEVADGRAPQVVGDTSGTAYRAVTPQGMRLWVRVFNTHY